MQLEEAPRQTFTRILFFELRLSLGALWSPVEGGRILRQSRQRGQADKFRLAFVAAYWTLIRGGLPRSAPLSHDHIQTMYGLPTL